MTHMMKTRQVLFKVILIVFFFFHKKPTLILNAPNVYNDGTLNTCWFYYFSIFPIY